MVQQPATNRSRLKVLRTRDPRSAFKGASPAEILAAYGYPRYLLSSSAKAKKSLAVGVLNRVLYLTSGVFCPAATEGCLSTCLGHSSGRMQLPTSARARDRRTALYLEDQKHFMQLLRSDLMYLSSEARQREMLPAVRLNGTSDLPWERLHREIFEEFPEIFFFDYTKLFPRMSHFLRGGSVDHAWPDNYHLTFSYSGKNFGESIEILSSGGNVAVVFEDRLPSKHWNFSVIDGDRHDARFFDPHGTVIGLRAKGSAAKDQTGFVERPTSPATAD